MNPDPAGQLAGLPHGESFRFVDEVVALEPGKTGKGIYRIRGSEAFLEGHFPGNPIMPGVILIESIAQLGGVVAQSDPVTGKLGELRLTAVRAAKILGEARPGEILEIAASVEGRMGGLVQLDGQVTVNGQMLASAKVVLSGSVE